MRIPRLFLLLLLLTRIAPMVCTAADASAIPSPYVGDIQPVERVNPFIGTGETGNCYPGAQAPFGLISWSPSTTFKDYDGEYSRPGYKYGRDEIMGFALTHISGVGCHAAQDMPIMPVSGALGESPVNRPDAYRSRFTHSRERASPGFYQVHLEDTAADVQIAVTERAGLARIDFEKSAERTLLFRPTESVNHLAGASMAIDPSGRRLSGWMASGGFCSRNPHDNTYTLYFCAEFDRPILTSGFWKGDVLHAGATRMDGDDIAAFVSFGSEQGVVQMKIGLSYVNAEKAAANLQSEIPGWELAPVAQRTRARWNELLGRASIAASREDQEIFYTAFYHNMLQPSVFDDADGQYRGFDNQVHQLAPGRHKYVNFSNWDTYRTSAQLQGLLFPEVASDMVSSLLLDFRQGAPKGFPNWGYFNREAGVMNGYSGIPFAVNAWVFGGRAVDTENFVTALVEAADRCYDRGELYKKFGYVPSYESRWNFSASMTLEYSIADFCVARLAEATGRASEARRFLARAQSVFNLIDPDRGYLRPRLESGGWHGVFSETQEEGFNEGNTTQYTWSVPQNYAGLIQAVGGPEVVERRLDSFLSKILISGWNTDQPYFWPANEPCFGVPYLYNWLGKPWKTQEITHRLREIFTNTPDGIPGDDDVGATSAYYVFNALGLYPSIPGVAGFTLSSPGVSAARLDLGDRGRLTLRADATGKYIRSVHLDGKTWESAWIYLDELTRGKEAELRFELGESPNREWGADEALRPPSFR